MCIESLPVSRPFRTEPNVRRSAASDRELIGRLGASYGRRLRRTIIRARGIMGTARCLFVAFLIALLPTSACAGSQNCTMVGCESGVGFDLPRVLDPGQEFNVRACVDDFCREASGTVPDLGCATDGNLAVCGSGSSGADVQLVLPGGRYDGMRDVRLELTSRSGAVLAESHTTVEFERLQPNGLSCGPVCWGVSVPTS